MAGLEQSKAQEMAFVYMGWTEPVRTAVELMPRSGTGFNVILFTKLGADLEGVKFQEIPEGQDFVIAPQVTKDHDDWRDVFVRELKPETAKAALAHLNNCRPDQIEL